MTEGGEEEEADEQLLALLAAFQRTATEHGKESYYGEMITELMYEKASRTLVLPSRCRAFVSSADVRVLLLNRFCSFSDRFAVWRLKQGGWRIPVESPECPLRTDRGQWPCAAEALEFATGHEETETIAKVYRNYEMGNHRHETGTKELLTVGATRPLFNCETFSATPRFAFAHFSPLFPSPTCDETNAHQISKSLAPTPMQRVVLWQVFANLCDPSR
ncbi:uncharacterized protein Triagg1_8927 [Trichoderma aggressivum f. europaeum]|uniref:Uncharacterized protein n=1 Tax=Trichoderma aggressivum f. europaeum TaxID=173218 RepID=A0AAE1IB63_9HYPO|nr:hypothetical protein Triagg1_8927 [Trichoderma aggressivum f. europaeum]